MIKFILCLMFVQPAMAANCDKQPTYCQIINNHPKIKKPYALRLSTVINKVSDKHDLDAGLLAAILAQESMYKLSSKNCRSGKCTDFGIGQIWHKTARSYEFDLNLLTNDLNYSVNAAAIVLKDFKKRYSKREKTWWTRYNASSKDKRKVYKKLVDRYIAVN